MGIGPETAGVMTFSQRATEQRVIFLHGWWGPRFREARAGVPIQINILHRGHLAAALQKSCRQRGDYQCVANQQSARDSC